MTVYDMDWQPSDFRPGQRVELHPGHDAWVAGDRFGDVARVGRRMVAVHMDRSGRTLSVHPARLGKVAS
jgi:hypothetical protein